MPLSRYCIQFNHPESIDQVVLFSTRTAAMVSFHRDVLQDMERGILSSDEREAISELGLYITSIDEEKLEMRSYIDRMNIASRTLKPLVVLNLDCNLACAYCFEGTRKGKHFLSEETATWLMRFIDNRMDKKDDIKITFYGGEPLLSTDMIMHIAERTNRLSDARGIAYGFNLITNGTLLTRRVVESLKPLGLQSVSVTLDGPSNVHDQSRPYKSGTGSFDTIISNLQDICDLIDIEIGGNFTQTNYRMFPELLDVLIKSGLSPDQISSVRFDPVYNEGNDYSPDFHGGCSSLNEPWIAEAGVFLRSEIMNHGYHTDDIQPSVCMMERHDNFVVNYDGSLYKCPGLIGRTEFRSGTVKTGMSDYGVLHNLGNWKNEECIACAYLPLCFGGCRYMKLIREGTMRGVDCKKEYLDRTLEKLVLQDIKRIKEGEL